MVAMTRKIAMLDTELTDTVCRLRRRLWLERGLFLAVLSGAAVFWAYPMLFPRAWAAYVDGKPVVALKSRESLEAALTEVKRAEGAGPNAGFVQNVRLQQVDARRIPPA